MFIAEIKIYQITKFDTYETKQEIYKKYLSADDYKQLINIIESDIVNHTSFVKELDDILKDESL